MPQLTLAEYARGLHNVELSRDDGVLELRLHTEGADFTWSAGALQELSCLFSQISQDRENRCLIITGTGDSFCADMDRRGGPGGVKVSGTAEPPAAPVGIPPPVWDMIYSHAKQLHTNLLNIEVPVIAAVNGPALIRADIALLSDIVLASENAEFQDAPHFANGVVPGDGVHLLWPLLLGPNRGRYFLLTGQRLSAAQALEWGVVSEVLPREQLMARARELARGIAAQPVLTTRYARVALTQSLRVLMAQQLGHGLALEGLAAGAFWPGAR